ncbi:MAG TPA: hypothetical protein VFP10_07820, partial [Candidatus Eisenbacteria bacterium]|nr:hypothetical protein [Candidatus Eisenbacteria bacterium]
MRKSIYERVRGAIVAAAAALWGRKPVDPDRTGRIGRLATLRDALGDLREAMRSPAVEERKQRLSDAMATIIQFQPYPQQQAMAPIAPPATADTLERAVRTIIEGLPELRVEGQASELAKRLHLGWLLATLHELERLPDSGGLALANLRWAVEAKAISVANELAGHELFPVPEQGALVGYAELSLTLAKLNANDEVLKVLDCTQNLEPTTLVTTTTIPFRMEGADWGNADSRARISVMIDPQNWEILGPLFRR